jgi:tetratricopeptide (TPR) repeat protein
VRLEARNVGAQGALRHGREAAQRLAWADAHAALSLADQSSSLAAEDLELLATAAYLLGNMEQCLAALQRAEQLYAEGGDHRRAARCAFWLTFHYGNRGDLAQASGWFARTNRLLEHERQECAEHGYLLISTAYQRLMAGDYVEARETLANAAGIGARVGDADLTAFALQLQGRALVWEGRVGEGLALLDEAMVAVVTGELSPTIAGTVYCGMIEICQEISELRRAQEWTEALTAWWSRQPDLVTFTGQCLVHRAEIHQLRGAWPEAVREAALALERLARAADQYATGAAWYQQAELYRLSGGRGRLPAGQPVGSPAPAGAGAAAAGPGQDRDGRGGEPPRRRRDEPAVQASQTAARPRRDHAGGRRPPDGR